MDNDNEVMRDEDYLMEECHDCIHVEVCKYPRRIKMISDRELLPINFQLATCKHFISASAILDAAGEGEDADDELEVDGEMSLVAGIMAGISEILAQGVSIRGIQMSQESWEMLYGEVQADPDCGITVEFKGKSKTKYIIMEQGTYRVQISKAVPLGQFFVLYDKE